MVDDEPLATQLRIEPRLSLPQPASIQTVQSSIPVIDAKTAEVVVEEEISPPITQSRADASRRRISQQLAAKVISLSALKEVSWSGVPGDLRPTVWRLLTGAMPAASERRIEGLQAQREAFASLASRYVDRDESLATAEERKLRHQISIDLPRTHPAAPFFQAPWVQASLARVLFLWSIRHPGSGYVQGMNDLVTPFFLVYLRENVPTCSLDGSVSCEPPEKSVLAAIEADCYWGFSHLLDSIQDNYTFAQSGIQRQIRSLEELVHRVDGKLWSHLQEEGVQFLQFAFRWFNCMMMREFPLRLIVRLWDTYLSEEDFATLHVYVCAAFLVHWSQSLCTMDFQDIMLFLQSPATENWSEEDIGVLLAKAFMWKTMFGQSPSHFRSMTAAEFVD
jgi:TBC1 domain family member 2